MSAEKLYVIGNGHIDPVWIWRRSSGRNAWVNTVTSTVKIMEEFPMVKFSCSSAALYRWIEETEPALFRKIAKLVEAGRWEIVGAWEVQSDVILSRPEILLRQGETAKRYFREKFGKEVDIGYNVDSFGHTEGLPKILNATGFRRYVFMRPQEPSLPLFRWRSGDSMVTALRLLNSYAFSAKTSEQGLQQRIDHHFENGCKHQTMFFGIGDHGGGIYRRHLEWLLKAAETRPIEFSTLGEYFDRIEQQELPEFEGELGPVFKGCYSACHKVKQLIAHAGERIVKAEKLGATEEELKEPWRELLFEHFHDVLPGTSVYDAVEKDIAPGIGSVIHKADALIDRQLARRNAAADTAFMPEGGVQVWNPHPYAHMAIVRYDGFSDPNDHGAAFDAFTAADGTAYPIQYLPAATVFGPCGEPWQRFTAVVPVPPGGEVFLAASRTGRKWENVGFARQKKVLGKLSFPVFFDNTRTWGFGLEAFADAIGKAELTQTREYQDGPVCSVLRTFWRYENSEIMLDIIDYRSIGELQLRIRLNWHEKRCCLKLAYEHGLEFPAFFTGQSGVITKRMKSGATGMYEQYDGRLRPLHPVSGEAAMIEFCAANLGEKSTAFYCADLHSCDHAENKMRITLCRPVLYGDHAPFAQSEEYGWMEQGISWRELWLLEPADIPVAELPRLAQARLANSEAREVAPHEASADFTVPPIPEFEAKTTVLNAVIHEDGKRILSLCNYGAEEQLLFADGKKVKSPAHSVYRLTLTNC